MFEIATAYIVDIAMTLVFSRPGGTPTVGLTLWNVGTYKKPWSGYPGQGFCCLSNSSSSLFTGSVGMGRGPIHLSDPSQQKALLFCLIHPDI